MAEQNALAKYDPRQYQVIARPEDLMPLSKLVTIDLVAVDLGQCANVGQGNFMPSRDKTDQIGSAAGITFVEEACAVTKIEPRVWVGRATARRMARDGSTQTMVAEYEWDAELRAEENAKAASGPKYDRELMQCRKFGRQRADTGARLRVIRALTGIPTAFKQADLKRPLVLARCSRDTEAMMADPALRELLVQQMAGAAGDVFGPSAMRDVTPEPEALPAAPETPLDEETAEAVADAVVDDETTAEPQGFVGAETAPGGSLTDDEQAELDGVFGHDAAPFNDDEDVALERDWLRKELAKGLGPKGTEMVTAGVADPALTVETARGLREAVVSYRKQQAQTQAQGQS